MVLGGERRREEARHQDRRGDLPFTRYFSKYQQPTPSEELEARFNALEASLSARIAKLFGGEQ